MPSLKVYLAGSLFSQKDLLGNATLADCVRAASSGRYECVLPQDVESRVDGPMGVRDADLKLLMGCDAGIFKFDGVELDSGTVVEFVFAKCIDMPAVLLRTDFRKSGDQGHGMEPWNLMCSFFPRTGSLVLDSLSGYKSCLEKGGTALAAAKGVYESVAQGLVERLDAAIASKPLAKTPGEMEAILHWAMRFPGGGLERLCEEEPGFVDSLIRRRQGRGWI